MIKEVKQFYTMKLDTQGAQQVLETYKNIITHEDIKDSIVNEALIPAKQSFTINRLQGDLHRIISTIE
jgi:hypothetical protein